MVVSPAKRTCKHSQVTSFELAYRLALDDHMDSQVSEQVHACRKKSKEDVLYFIFSLTLRPGGGGGYLTKLFTRRLRLKKVPLSQGAFPYWPL